MLLIKKEKVQDTNYHELQEQSWQTENWLGDEWFIVPDELREKVWDCAGHCDLVVKKDELIDITPKKIPVNLDEIKNKKLSENSTMCNNIIENKFMSKIKGDGLQPYRMNRDDQANLSGLQGIINTMLITGKQDMDIPLFSWQNANQIKCSNDWHYTQILGLITEFGSWKTLVLKRQDEIKERILNAETMENLSAITPDYSDLLIFDNKY